MVLHVDAAVLADPDQTGQSVLEDGVRVPAETSQRLACDASRAAAAARWITAVNADGRYGRWAYRMADSVPVIGSMLDEVAAETTRRS